MRLMFNFNREVCRLTLTAFFAGVRVRELDDVEVTTCPKHWL
jgi:hypothetical protein